VAKRPSSPPLEVLQYINLLKDATETDLITLLQQSPTWRFPRGDLHGWIPVLDHFDSILENLIDEHQIARLQTKAFSPKAKGLVLEILKFQRLLLENCTNRKLFSSYDVRNSLLFSHQTADLTAVECSPADLRPRSIAGRLVLSLATC
jgi:E3 ubiquitin-protein ligase HUWE1